ncbi:hypothetical protein ABTJ80_19875, partial [Acinetobacter baumannii]
QAVGGERPEGHAGETEKCRQQQEGTKHGQDSGDSIQPALMAAPFFQAKPRMLRSLFRRLFKYLLWFMAASVVLVAVLRWVPPPGTMVMVERK